MFAKADGVRDCAKEAIDMQYYNIHFREQAFYSKTVICAAI